MNWKNRTVFTGDNLDVMRGMNSESVDLIYADPPFNSNKNYAAPIGSEAAGAAFKDTWTRSDIDLAWMGIIADRHPGVYKVVEAAEAAHGKGMQSYLCMIGIRLLEMRRILKATGSIYLHCDDTASHWLRCLMEAVFGRSAFRNEVVWKRVSNHNDAGRFGRTADKMLFFGAKISRSAVRVPLTDDNVTSKYRHRDRRGTYRTGDITGPGVSQGEAGQSWRGWNPTDIGRCWSVPRTGAYATWIEKNLIPGYQTEGSILARLDMLDEAGLIVFTSKGTPELKRYLDASPGQVPPDIWTDILPVNSQAKERLGYPTQKPIALLDRIISASSKPGDVVFDPFCGCATALVSAEKQGRQWVGIDISEMAVRLVRHRLYREVPLFTQDAIDRTDMPRRTDLVDEIREYQNDKHVLYGQQEGRCNGCRVTYDFRNMEVDHVVARAKGGADHISNYQLLCPACNRMKGKGSHEELIAKLKSEGIIAA